MTLLSIAIFTIGALLYGWLLPARWRGWALLVGSVVAIYWLQPRLTIRPLDFLLPTFTLALSMAGWYATRSPDQPRLTRDDQLTVLLSGGLVLLLALVGTLVTPSTPPPAWQVIILLGLLALVGIMAAPLTQDRNTGAASLIALVILLLVILKWEPLTAGVASLLRLQTGRVVAGASAVDLGWLGFSYVAFRLIHTLRDRQSGKLPTLSLREYLTYVIFFPAYTAGPIDRAERFVKDYRALAETTSRLLNAPRLVEGVTRITVGIFKKFVLADNLGRIALNATNAVQIQGAGTMWLATYAYAFQLFLDFSGYSDIAIGIGRLFGITLPENFNRPYLKPSITAFWQSWHATLSTWARFYVFTPLSRNIMNLRPKPAPDVAVLITQVATMLVIGLWHGITWNFIIWGIWHAVGLWLHKLYSDRTRVFYQQLKDKPAQLRWLNWLSIAVTFHFVVLGWVWFALPSVGLSWQVFGKLFGLP